MRAVSSWLARHTLAWRGALVVATLCLGASAVVVFGFGTCHDSGGFCSSEFGSTHVEAYASGAFLAAAAAVAGCCLATRRLVVLALTAAATAAIVGMAAVLLEATT